MEILGKDYLLVTLDFETFYGTGYSLRSLNTFAYVSDERFSIHGVGVQIDDGQPKWYRDTQSALNDIASAAGDKPIALLCQNTGFDAWILAHHFDWHPDLYLDTMGMSRGMFPGLPASLEKLCERLWPNDKSMRKGREIVKFANVTTEELWADEALEKAMEIYCIGAPGRPGDVPLTYEAFKLMLPHYPDRELELIDLTLRMRCEPMLHIDVDRTQKHLDASTKHQEGLIKASGVARTTLSSNAQFARWIEDQGIEVPMKPSPTAVELNAVGEEVPKMIPALGKSDLGFQKMRADHPEFEHVWAARLASKSVGEITRAKRFLETAEQCKGMMPVPLSYYSAHCVPGDTEVLTPKGWVALEDWQGGDIAQVDTKQGIHFLPATLYEGPVVDQWAIAQARYLPCAFTLGHKVPYLQHGSHKWGVLSAAEAAERGSLYVPIGGTLSHSGAITPEQMRVLVMIQADGSFCTDTAQGRGVSIFVKKERKIQRARKLLTEARIPFRESGFPSHPGYVRFSIAHRDYPEWLTPERKFFGHWLLDSTPDAREAFAQELRHWDGGLNGRTQWSYSTSIKENADWVVTMFHLTGRSASITVSRGGERDGYIRTDNFTVNARQRAFAQIKRRQWQKDSTPRKTYCARTISGYWLARANGRIFVTGNTGRYGGSERLNLQNLGRGSELRKSLSLPTWEVEA